MNFYNPKKLFYCGIDLHAKNVQRRKGTVLILYVELISGAGYLQRFKVCSIMVKEHRKIKAILLYFFAGVFPTGNVRS